MTIPRTAVLSFLFFEDAKKRKEKYQRKEKKHPVGLRHREQDTSATMKKVPKSHERSEGMLTFRLRSAA